MKLKYHFTPEEARKLAQFGIAKGWLRPPAPPRSEAEKLEARRTYNRELKRAERAAKVAEWARLVEGGANPPL